MQSRRWKQIGIIFLSALLALIGSNPVLVGAATATAASVNVYIDSDLKGTYSLFPSESTRQSYSNIDTGAVRIDSTNGIFLIASERVIYKVNQVNTSFSEIMALPKSQLSTTYWLPWYNNVDLSTQLRFGNVTQNTATVHIYVGAVEMTGSPFLLGRGESKRVVFTGVNNGPVEIQSDQDLIAAERVIYKVNGVNTSFSEMMALPDNQIDMVYWLPWYNNVDLDTQLRIANLSPNQQATVHVSIGGQELNGSPIVIQAGKSIRKNFIGVNSGPLKIQSDQNIVAAERVIYKVNGVNTSFSEMMALPNSQLDSTYWLPWYNNISLDTQLRFGVP